MNLKKIVILKNVLDILTDNEMKSTLAGYGSNSNYCYPGQYLYFCTDIRGGGGPGYACGISADSAGIQATWDQCSFYQSTGELCLHFYVCS